MPIYIKLRWNGQVVCEFTDGHFERFGDVGERMLERITLWLWNQDRGLPRPHWHVYPAPSGQGMCASYRGVTT